MKQAFICIFFCRFTENLSNIWMETWPIKTRRLHHVLPRGWLSLEISQINLWYKERLLCGTIQEEDYWFSNASFKPLELLTVVNGEKRKITWLKISPTVSVQLICKKKQQRLWEMWILWVQSQVSRRWQFISNCYYSYLALLFEEEKENKSPA